MLTLASMGYAFFQVEAIMHRGGIHTTNWDIIMGVVALLVVLEATRRTVGLAYPYSQLFFWVTPTLVDMSQDISDTLATVPKDYDSYLFIRWNIWYSCCCNCNLVVMFIVFGAFLEATGAGDYFGAG